MRYYDISITNPKTNKLLRGYRSFANGKSLPNALTVELNIPLYPYHTPDGSAYVRVWGVALTDIWQAADFNFANIEIFGGFQKGLPLNTPGQIGLLVKGTILQAYGNWIGVDQTLDMQIIAPTGMNDSPANLVLNWTAGTPLATALAVTFKTAYPNLKQVIAISPKLVRSYTQPAYYMTLEQLSAYVFQASRDIIKGTYPGVWIVVSGDTITILDGTQTQAVPTSIVKQIRFQDLIGQPTWLEDAVIQIKCPMRGDLEIGMRIKMPPAIVTNTGLPTTSLVNLRSAFLGTFYVQKIRHYGNSRQPDAASWVTVIDAVPEVLE